MKRTCLFSKLARGFFAIAFCHTATASEPLVTNTTSFRIPFAVESEGVGEVSGQAILYASVNGAPMEQVQKVQASAGGFQFNASKDGLYAFAVRVTDAAGNLAGPPSDLTPELLVSVDTTPPGVDVQLIEVAPGQVQVKWNCNESRIAPGSFRLEYAEGTNGRWKQFPTSSEPAGQTTISSSPGTSVSVRAFVNDLAGNQGSGTGQVILSVPKPPEPAQQPAPAAGTTQPVVNQVAQSPQIGIAFPYESPAAASSSGQNSALTGGSGGLTLPPPYHAQVGHTAFSGTTHTSSGMFGGTPTANVQPSYSQPPFSQQGNGLFAGNSGSALPPGATQIVNNRVFDIAYQVEDVGPSGVSCVELFVTENNGREWFRYGNDVDLQSPFQVDSRGEGTFGFAVRVKNGLGFSEAPPQPGEFPSIVITVDQSPPTIEFAPPQVLPSGQGKIRLQWRVTDANPATAPVRLEYSVSTAGPWNPVFDWQMDPHSFELPIQPGMPTALHFRLLARDLAGNVATAQTHQPVLIDQHRPTVKLLRVQPVSTTTQQF